MAYSITHMALLQALTSILLFASSSILLVVQAGSAAESTTSSAGTYRFELTHVDANRGFTREELIQRSEARAKLRAAMLSSDLNTHAKYRATAEYAPQEYLMELQIGTPPLTFKAVADTGSQLVWTRKPKNCRCAASSSFRHWSCANPVVSSRSINDHEHELVPCSNKCKPKKQMSRPIDPLVPRKKPETSVTCKESSSCCCDAANGGPCMFNKTYGGGNTSGFMANEELTFPSKKEKNEELTLSSSNKATRPTIDLGCAIYWTYDMLPESADGIVGLNQGGKSLVKQLHAKKLAYCLSDRFDKNAPPSQLLFDVKGNLELASAAGTSSLPTTPLVEAEDADGKTVGTWMYHVQLDGISIGENKMHKSLPRESFKRKSKTSGGDKGVVFVDSGATYTFLEKDVFAKLKELLNMELKADEKDNNCFRLRNSDKKPPPPFPEMVLYFPDAKTAAGSVEMRLPWANYMVETEAGSGLFKLTVFEAENQSILGNFQQQNMHMLFDLNKKELQFALHKDCGNL